MNVCLIESQLILPEIFIDYPQQAQNRIIEVWRQIMMNPPLKIIKYSKREYDLIHSMIGTFERKAFLIFSNKIGEGSSKIVKLGMELNTSQLRAIAKVRLTNESVKNFCDHETQMMKLFNEDRFIYLDDFFERNNKYYFVMEYCPGGDLFSFIERNPTPIFFKCKIAFDIAKSLQLFHDQNYIHRDIKPENIFLTSEGQAKVGDLNYMILEEDLKKNLTPKGTLHYLAPEICQEMIQNNALSSQMFSKKSDVWALGCVFYILFNPLKTPLLWCHTTKKFCQKMVQSNQFDIDRSIRLLGVPACIQNLIGSMLKIDPELRFDIDQVVDALMLFIQVKENLENLFKF